MNKQLKVSASIDISAPPEKVWSTLTEPPLIKQYLFGTETITDWKVGSPIRFEGVYNDISYQDKGMVRENKPFHTLSYAYWSGFSGLEDLPENYAWITYNLLPLEKGKTRFTWTQEGFSTEEGKNHSESGMSALLNSIKEITERS
jgi:uncharacterized protein YndB with AHSA1/START domain